METRAVDKRGGRYSGGQYQQLLQSKSVFCGSQNYFVDKFTFSSLNIGHFFFLQRNQKVFSSIQFASNLKNVV